MGIGCDDHYTFRIFMSASGNDGEEHITRFVYYFTLGNDYLKITKITIKPVSNTSIAKSKDVIVQSDNKATFEKIHFKDWYICFVFRIFDIHSVLGWHCPE